MQTIYDEIRIDAETKAQRHINDDNPAEAIKWLQVCKLAQENRRLWVLEDMPESVCA